MKMIQYQDTTTFAADVMDILLINEVQNNLLIGLIRNERQSDTSQWLMATVKDNQGSVLLTAMCTPPFNLILCETDNRPNPVAIQLISDELLRAGIKVPGVIAEKQLAHRFAAVHVGNQHYLTHLSLVIMRLDQVKQPARAPGSSRLLRQSDLFFTPYWERSFAEECEVEVYSIEELAERVKQRIDRKNHFIWEHDIPVSQVVNNRNTENGAVLGVVYTPPFYRGKGYASSLVAEASQILLDRGHQFCCLFADAKNPISCGIYRKIGFYDQCIFDELRFIK